MSFKNLHSVFLVSLIALATMGSCNKDERELIKEPTIIYGTVEDIKSGKPIQGAKIEIIHRGGSNPNGSTVVPLDSTYTDENGEYNIQFKYSISIYTVDGNRLWGCNVSHSDYWGAGETPFLGEINRIDFEIEKL